MRVGSVVFSTDQGLGYLAKSFYDAGVLTHPMVLAHGRRPDHLDWFPGHPIVRSLRSERQRLLEHCRSVDVMLFFETPFDWLLIDHCRKVGTKTILMPMHECMPEVLPAVPDVLACPSMLDWDLYAERGPTKTQEGSVDLRDRCIYTPVPVEPWWPTRIRGVVRKFVFNAGNGGLLDRNGTPEVVAALAHVRSRATIVIRSQGHSKDLERAVSAHAGRVDVHLSLGTQERRSLYEDGDAFVFPERFNGLSLPLQEARASGMVVIATDRYPINTWLPRSSLVPVSERVRERVSPRCVEFESSRVSPVELAHAIDSWYGRDGSAESEAGIAWGSSMQWSVLRPGWERLLESLKTTGRVPAAVPDPGR